MIMLYILTGILIIIISIFNFVMFGLYTPNIITLSVFEKILTPITNIVSLILGFLIIIIGIKKFQKGSRTNVYLKMVSAFIIIETLSYLYGLLMLYLSNGWNVCVGYSCPSFILGWVLLITAPIYLILLILILTSINNKKLYWCTGIALIVLLLGFFAYISLLVPRSSDDCAKFNDVNKLDSCYVNFAIKNKDIMLCNKTRSDNYYYNFCLSQVTDHDSNQQLNHLEICEIYRPDDYLSQDTCYLVVARDRKEPSICQKIKSDSTKNECISQSST